MLESLISETKEILAQKRYTHLAALLGLLADFCNKAVPIREGGSENGAFQPWPPLEDR